MLGLYERAKTLHEEAGSQMLCRTQDFVFPYIESGFILWKYFRAGSPDCSICGDKYFHLGLLGITATHQGMQAGAVPILSSVGQWPYRKFKKSFGHKVRRQEAKGCPDLPKSTAVQGRRTVTEDSFQQKVRLISPVLYFLHVCSGIVTVDMSTPLLLFIILGNWGGENLLFEAAKRLKLLNYQPEQKKTSDNLACKPRGLQLAKSVRKAFQKEWNGVAPHNGRRAWWCARDFQTLW